MESSKSITAVEWLVDYIENLNKSGYEFRPKYNEDIVQQAKEIEKQQIENAYKDSTSQFSVDARIDYPKTAEQYFSETFKKQII